MNNLIVKKRAINLLVRLSDFDALEDNLQAKESLAQGVLRIFASEEHDNADLCLKMCCIEYMRNFFNDHNFRVNSFAHIVPEVVKMGSTMMSKCVQNSEAINEILDLFRFIVDKYSGMTLAMPTINPATGADQNLQLSGQTVNDYLISML